MADKVRVLIADDHGVLRAGLRKLLETEADIEVVAEAADGEAAVELTLSERPDVILLDVNMPNLTGIEAARRLREEGSEARILVLTMHDDPAYVRELLALGAAGYVLKRSADTELLAAIRAVYHGGTVIPTEVAQALASPEARAEAHSPLTEREREILGLIVEGYTNREIAERLVISIKTVEGHRAHIQDKLDIRTRAGLVKYAIAHGLLKTDEPGRMPET